MKFMRYLLTALILWICVTAYAEEPEKARPVFWKASDYSLKIDRSKTNYNGMDSVNFVRYYAAKFNMEPKNLSVFLDFIPQRLASAMAKKLGKRATISFNGNSRYGFIVELTEITEKAGLKAKVIRYVDQPSNGEVVDVEVPDGRWNSFDVLLEENIEELAEQIVNPNIRGGCYKSVKRMQIR